MEKVTAVQKNHYEKLNQLENLLKLIIKNVDVDDDGSCNCKKTPMTAEMTQMRLRGTTFDNVLNDLHDDTLSNHSTYEQTILS